MRAISPSAEMTSTYAVKYKYLIFAAEPALMVTKINTDVIKSDK